MSDNLTLLGHVVNQPVIQLETFNAPKNVRLVTLSTSEITSLCPVTGQPDFISARITYQPNEKCLESKSLKLYLWTFRESGQFLEALSSKMLNDLWEALAPKQLQVELTMAPRGGITIEAFAGRSV